MRHRSRRPSAGGLPRGATPTAAPRRLRLLICVLALLALAASPGLARAAPPDAATAKLGVVPDGEGTVALDPTPAGAVACAGTPDEPQYWGSADELKYCGYDYDRGQAVTLTAVPNAPGISFVGWSDARCPGTGQCTLRMDADSQSVTALFSPQHVKVAFGGPGTVSTAAGDVCRPEPESDPWLFDCGSFPVMSQVTLRANPGTNPAGQLAVPNWDALLCDPPAPKKRDALCTISVHGATWGSVGFDDDPGGDFRPAISVKFRIFKQGSGSGTVRSQSLDCGRICALERHFGERETLVADPAPGSTFGGWRGMCSTSPRCSLAVGPVTTVVAVFDQSETAKGGSRDSSPAPAIPAARRERSRAHARFVARLKRIAVTGHGRHRKVLMRVQINAPATIRAVLGRGRHRVAGQRWRVSGGTPLLRLRVPARARPGGYRLVLSLRDAAGHATHVKRRVSLPL
jgi:hypothetical protein